MKNHWLDKKTDKEIDAALAEIENLGKDYFKDSDPIELPGAQDLGFIDLEDQLKFIDDLEAKCGKDYDILNSTDQEDRDMIKAILLKNMHKSHWVEEVLTQANYVPHLAPGCDGLGNLTISCGYGFSTTMTDTINSSSVTAPGGDGIKLADLPGWKDGVIVDMDVWKGKCDKCGEYQWPMNDENTMTQGDPACKCYGSCCNLDIFCTDRFVQNETLQVINDRIEGRDILKLCTMYTPVLPGTMIGTVYPNPESDGYGFVFDVSADGTFDFKPFVKQDDGTFKYPEEPDPTLSQEESDRLSLEKLANGEFDDTFLWYDEVYSWETSLNCATGVLELRYHMGHCPKVVVSYEYNKDC